MQCLPEQMISSVKTKCKFSCKCKSKCKCKFGFPNVNLDLPKSQTKEKLCKPGHKRKILYKKHFNLFPHLRVQNLYN